MVVATGVASGVGVDSTVAVEGGASVVEIGSCVELRKRRCCGPCVCGVGDVVDHPSSVAVAEVVSAAGAAAAACSACVCWATCGNDGIGGGRAPIASSYTGNSGSALGWAGAGRVMYAFVRTGTVWGACE
jgi:hypothetical protein